MVEDVQVLCLRFSLAVVLAGAVGLERERKGRAAGLRTHILVCLGSTLAVSVADLLAADWAASGAPIWLDKGRIAAGVLTGVGFLGAGTIITVGGTQRGLTTAAMIWFVAALGIAIGAGYYLVAVCATVFALLVVLGFERLDELLPSQERFTLRLRLVQGLDQMAAIEQFLQENHCKGAASRMRLAQNDSHADVTLEVTARSDTSPEELVQSLRDRFPAAEEIVFER